MNLKMLTRVRSKASAKIKDTSDEAKLTASRLRIKLYGTTKGQLQSMRGKCVVCISIER